ncbi:hypothetical protein [Nitrosospira sp. Nsp13]|uniref:hypothetical protein n=1 Tax=Nitrosospira sp. Nsp13 TaxID=1855332 RepID=UPI00088AFB1A|nr:hypothetical protein [Nitrosospira sp. Nsp13]SCY53576.1 hypothetical protein SAMN05216308_1164 [Nitrosospira sp. Nsp13]
MASCLPIDILQGKGRAPAPPATSKPAARPGLNGFSWSRKLPCDCRCHTQRQPLRLRSGALRLSWRVIRNRSVIPAAAIIMPYPI